MGITSDISFCARHLEDGNLVAIPTETVYGLAANAFDEQALNKIFELKKRPRFNPLIVHIGAIEQLYEVTSEVPEEAELLAKNFWPGPLTLVLPKKSHIPEIVTAGHDTVGIRMPNHPVSLELLRKLDFPLCAPSANPFTRISPTTAGHVYDYFGDHLTVLEGGSCQVGLESTIVGFPAGVPTIYRKGGLPIEAIEQLIGSVKTDLKENEKPIAPGMLLKHYAPQSKVVFSNNLPADVANAHGKVGILRFSGKNTYGAQVIRVLSEKSDMNEAANNLYQMLMELDALDLDLIIAERLPDEGLGRSINDRLERAAHA